VRFRLVDPVIAVAHDGTKYTGYGDFAEGWNAAVGETTNRTPRSSFSPTGRRPRTVPTAPASAPAPDFMTEPIRRVPYAFLTGKYITLDLNGFTIDRNLNEPCSDYGGWVIANLGTLTIRDSGTGGTITGGYTGRNL
jgi:hypothetical protein